MVRLSERAIKVISELEFQEKYYFKKKDIIKYFKNKKQLSNFLYNQRKNKRIIKLNRDKYFLIPIRARKGKWIENPLIVVDEIMDGKDYYIGGWYGANYWRLTTQVAMQVDIYTTRRQGKIKVFNKRFVFHRVKKRSLTKGVKKIFKGHQFIILNKKEMIKWVELKK